MIKNLYKQKPVINCDPEKAKDISFDLRGEEINKILARILTSEKFKNTA